MKILFLSDVFRHPIHHAPTNHDWLLNLWFQGDDYEIVRIRDLVISDDIINLLPKTPYATVEEENISPITEYFREITKPYDVLIAFECTEETRNILNSFHNKIVFIYFSPLRYCDRQTFSLSSNDLFLQQKLESVSIKATEYYYQQANYVKELINNNFPKLEYPKNSTLLVGQVEEDLSVWNGHIFLCLDDYLSEIITSSSEKTSFYYKAHPFSKNNNPEIRANPVIQNTDEEIYRLLSSDSINEVVTTSSSVAEEAHFFGKKVTQFLHSYIPENSKNIPYTMSMSFWNYLFEETNTLQTKTLTVDSIDIRPIRKLYWGYKSILELQSFQTEQISSIKQSIDEFITENDRTTNSSISIIIDQLISKNTELERQIVKLQKRNMISILSNIKKRIKKSMR